MTNRLFIRHSHRRGVHQTTIDPSYVQAFIRITAASKTVSGHAASVSVNHA